MTTETKNPTLDALAYLVKVKEWKDKYGKDGHYRTMQPKAWAAAKRALDEAAVRGEKPTECDWCDGPSVSGRYCSDGCYDAEEGCK